MRPLLGSLCRAVPRLRAWAPLLPSRPVSTPLHRGFATEKEHPFDAFFHNQQPGRVGRAWRASELRLKSFDDLQKLWFVLLKERNMLATYKELCRQKGATMQGSERLWKCKLSMARIRTVVHERTIKYKCATIGRFRRNERRRLVLRQAERQKEKRKRLMQIPHKRHRPMSLLSGRKKLQFKRMKPRPADVRPTFEELKEINSKASVHKPMVHQKWAN